jgi:pyrroloquinoline quinone (PQQ) biosynthesis protein C
MQDYSSKINGTIEPLRQEIINHKVYSAISSLDELKIFMQYHVYAVWDFMSLLKSLQNQLTCVAVPWFPNGDPNSRYLINEIVVGEESDVDSEGNRTSHFELYLKAMEQTGCDTASMNNFIDTLKTTGNFEEAFAAGHTPFMAQKFVNFTFDVIRSNKAYLQAAIFTFGREDLIPGMFISMVNDLNRNFPESISQIKYYLERHIEVDGDHHSHLALQMTANLCGENEQRWQEAEQAVVESLKMRVALWDGVYEEIMAKKSVVAD